jgi:prolyl-tRNA synthetase
VLPPNLAPHQVVIVPIGRGEGGEAAAAAAHQLAAEIKATGVRVHVDDRPQVSPGFKFNDWEMKGVPLRLELGPRDLEAGVVVMSQRLNADPEAGKQQLPLATVVADLPGILQGYQHFLLARAAAFRDEHTQVVDDWDSFAAAVSTGWAVAFHCGRPSCEDDIKAQTQATPRNVPTHGAAETGVCVRCGEPSAYGKRVIFGRAY